MLSCIARDRKILGLLYKLPQGAGKAWSGVANNPASTLLEILSVNLACPDLDAVHEAIQFSSISGNLPAHTARVIA